MHDDVCCVSIELTPSCLNRSVTPDPGGLVQEDGDDTADEREGACAARGLESGEAWGGFGWPGSAAIADQRAAGAADLEALPAGRRRGADASAAWAAQQCVSIDVASEGSGAVSRSLRGLWFGLGIGVSGQARAVGEPAESVALAACGWGYRALPSGRAASDSPGASSERRRVGADGRLDARLV